MSCAGCRYVVPDEHVSLEMLEPLAVAGAVTSSSGPQAGPAGLRPDAVQKENDQERRINDR